jgi:galactokinase
MNIQEAHQFLDTEKARKIFAELYGPGEAVYVTQKKRYADLLEQFRGRFGDDDVRIFSSPGRSEIGGNHTDHNHGKVLAASIQLDSIGVAAASGDNTISVFDLSYREDYAVDAAGPLEPSCEKGSAALIRGIAAGFKKEGFAAAGFKGCFTSDVLPASGVSSSAAFEMLICGILNTLYNKGAIPIEKLAAIGQYAENIFWGKASGLLDQMGCAAGGMAAIDFENPAAPVIQRIPFDFAAQHYGLILVNTGGNHANLSGEYSAIPQEMKEAASFFGKSVLRGLRAEELAENLPALRARFGDRAVLRAFHFIEENVKVEKEIEALRKNDFAAFLALVNESGNSSYKWLQNAYVPGAKAAEQSIPVSLALTEVFFRIHGLEGKAACRLHGGGFAGVIQVFLPEAEIENYRAWMHKALGFTGTTGSDESGQSPVFVMSIRPYGFLEIG